MVLYTFSMHLIQYGRCFNSQSTTKLLLEKQINIRKFIINEVDCQRTLQSIAVSLSQVYIYQEMLYLFINYNTITYYILIIHELSNFDHVLSVVSQTRASGGKRSNDPHPNSLADYPLHYHCTQGLSLFLIHNSGMPHI